MKQLSLPDRLVRYLKSQPGFVHSGELERLAMGAGYKGETAGRRLRELAEEGTLETKYERGSVLYRFKERMSFEDYWASNLHHL